MFSILYILLLGSLNIYIFFIYINNVFNEIDAKIYYQFIK